MLVSLAVTFNVVRRCVVEQCEIYLPEASIEELLKRLSRIEGQIRGIQRMVKERRSCDEILVQISAVKSALSGVAVRLLEDHAESCVKPSVELGDGKALDDFLEAVKKMIRGGC